MSVATLDSVRSTARLQLKVPDIGYAIREQNRRHTDPLQIQPSESLLHAALSLSIRQQGQWRCRGTEWLNRVGDLEDFAERRRVPQPQSLFKNDSKKLVFTWHDGSSDVPEFIVKVTSNLARRFRLQYRRRLDGEAINLACAERRGLPVPRMYACGLFGPWFCPRRFVICQQFVPWNRMLEELVAAPNESRQWDLMRRTGQVLNRLYEAGCVHIDFGPNAILVSPDPAVEDVVFDLEFAGFFDRPSPDAFAAQAGYFCRSVVACHSVVSIQIAEAWFAELLGSHGFSNAERLWKIWRQQLHTRESTRQRLQWR